MKMNKLKHSITSVCFTWIVVFGLIPVCLLLVTSILEQHPEKFFSLRLSFGSYQQIIDQAYLSILRDSLKISLLTTTVCLLIGYPFAWCTKRIIPKYRLVVLALLVIPFWTNSLVRAYAVRLLIGTKGILNKSLLYLGVIDSPIRLMYTEYAVIIGLIYLMLPFMIFPLYVNLEKFDYKLVEASRDLGASPFTTFIKIVLPLTQPGIMAGCIMVFVPTMGMFYVASLLGGAKNMLVGNLI